MLHCKSIRPIDDSSWSCSHDFLWFFCTSLGNNPLLAWKVLCLKLPWLLFACACFSLVSEFVLLTCALFFCWFFSPVTVCGFNKSSHVFCLKCLYVSSFICACPLLLVSWSLKYCSAVIGIFLMCLVFLVTICPVYLILPAIVVFVAMFFNCAMYPGSSIFSLSRYCGPFR